ncbi:hypothetical protein NMK71_08050 [Weeksellaceae bacterium KMM 9713]|uniref:Uncharacterized protein n=1 Tax=Profundicola chukchiensis TaxID=2961959 RepID=A0A9X4RUQ5_9FLAO|nr:hypothetical protein [Profundicola chukchiensis]MDG4946363.1 hypothetical protein [Profundicola chukchiensis]MDG4950903.1 hypothetical protein [Profundicola chukchiensis]
MKIKYKNRRLLSYLVFGVLWLVMGTLSMIYQPTGWFRYGFFVFGLMYLGQFAFFKTKQYLSIENGVLTKNSFFPKSIELDKVRQLKKHAGNYTLKTEDKKLIINSHIIEEESLKELNQVLDNLGLREV